MRSARRLGLRTVAVFSTADRESPHVTYADHACLIGEAPARESYLAIDKIIAAAHASGAQAVHPGYGFLAENAEFAAAVEAAGLTFIGPTAEAIRLMGNKAAAKERMLAAGVPCVPGYQGSAQDDTTFLNAAKKIGFPLMIKSAAGGGGRGMRLVHEIAQLPGALSSARSESLAAFGSDELILERAISDARHIEVQVFADSHGNVVHLGERDCSVQRRHQKLIEESPSPAVSPSLREKFGAAAVQAARSINYRGAGTIEFLLDASGEFYFMEMNTRLQVEHGVTELVTGLDLVEWQLRVAAGDKLPLSQDQVRLDGHAIEVRLCLEDSAQEFLPQTGQVLLWEPADGVRTDSALIPGLTISPYYDSMAAKVMAYAPTRLEAIGKLASACERTVLLGVRHNLAFLNVCLRHPQFDSGGATTSFIGNNFTSEQRQRGELLDAILAGASILFTRTAFGNAWTNAQGLYSLVEVASQDGAHSHLLRVQTQRDGSIGIVPHANPEAETLKVLNAVQTNDALSFELGALQHRMRYARAADDGLWLHYNGEQYLVFDVLHARTASGDSAGAAGGALRASLAGRLVAVQVSAGDSVTKGQTLVVLESMKMEHAVRAPFDGTVEEVLCALGEQVMSGKVLVRVAPTAAAEGGEQG
jgi:geranyl-CoA carboxylase alpha subunit